MSMVGNMKDELLFYQRILKFDKTFDFIHKPFNMTNIEKTIKRLADDIHNNSAKFLNLSNTSKLLL